MAVKLIPTGEHWVEIEESRFKISYITPAKLSALYNRHSERGEFNAVAATEELLSEYLHDWQGVTDEAGNEVEFKKEYIPYLPVTIQNELFNEIAKYAAGWTGEVEKNS